MNIGILKCKKVGMQVSKIWLCWLSTFNPEVGPNVVSLAGDPASPKAADAESNITVEISLRPNFKQTGIKNTANIGIVPKDVPIPIVIIKPKISIIMEAIILLVII